LKRKACLPAKAGPARRERPEKINTKLEIQDQLAVAVGSLLVRGKWLKVECSKYKIRSTNHSYF